MSPSHFLEFHIDLQLHDVGFTPQVDDLLRVVNFGHDALLDLGLEDQLSTIQIYFVLAFDLTLVIDQWDELVDADHGHFVALPSKQVEPHCDGFLGHFIGLHRYNII